MRILRGIYPKSFKATFTIDLSDTEFNLKPPVFQQILIFKKILRLNFWSFLPIRLNLKGQNFKSNLKSPFNSTRTKLTASKSVISYPTKSWVSRIYFEKWKIIYLNKIYQSMIWSLIIISQCKFFLVSLLGKLRKSWSSIYLKLNLFEAQFIWIKEFNCDTFALYSKCYFSQ